MSIAFEKNLKVRWVPGGVADMDSPTVAEAEGADDITPHIPVSGVDRPSQQNQSSLAMLDEAFISEDLGTWGVGPINLTFVRDPANEDADHPWQLFSYGDAGDLLVSPNDSWTADDEISVYRVKAHEPAEIPSAENTKQQFNVSFPVQRFVRRATIVAGT